MNIVLIGSGNVAWNIGKLCVQAGHTIQQIVSRNANTATQLAYEVDTESANYYSILQTNADVYIICIADDALTEVIGQLPKLNGLVLHTSGAIDAQVLQPISSNAAVLYPLQSLTFGSTVLPVIPFLIQGINAAAEQNALNFAQQLNSPAQIISSQQKLQMHIAAVMVNNFTHHLYVQAQLWCKQHQLDFNLLLPIISQTTQRLSSVDDLNQFNLATLQTGPAARHDTQTIQKHETQLAHNEQLLNLYRLFTSMIQLQKID